MPPHATVPPADAGPGVPADGAAIGFRPLTPADLPLLAEWLAEPHVARWWNHETTPEALDRDFGPAMRGEEPAEDLLVLLGDTPLGLLQRCRWHDYPEYVVEVAGIVTVPPGAVTIDYLVGRPADVHRGLGTRMITAAVADVWRRYPDAPAVLVPVNAANRASWRVLERAGFERAASGNLRPDNPADPPLHHLYRIDRPR